MGSSHSLQLVDCEEIKHHQWDQLTYKHSNLGKWRTLRNHRTGAMIDEYQLSWESKQEYSFYIKSFNWRNRRRNQSPIVLSVALKQLGHASICTEKYTANIYLEHIPLRLSEVQDIPICEALFILLESFEGYSQLYRHSGYFRIYQEQICIDRSGKVKVWVNADLSKNYPECDTDCGRSKKDQIDMVEQLLDIITKSTDAQQMPSPSLTQYFDMVRKRQVVAVGFQYAKIIAFQFARVYHIRIPNRFETVMQLFAPNLTLNKHYSTNIQTIPSSSIQFPRRQPLRLNHANSMPQFSQDTNYQPNSNELLYSHPLSQQVNYSNQNTFPYIAQTNESQYIHQIPQSLHLGQINLDRQQGQQTKRKSGNSNNSKRSKNSKSQMIIVEDNANHLYDRSYTQDRNTMKSMPNYNIKLSNNRFDTHLERVRHSQYLIGSAQQQRAFGRKTSFNKDSFGKVLPYRKKMKDSSSSNNLPSNSSSVSQKYQMSNKQSKGSEQFGQSNMMEQFKQIMLQKSKKECSCQEYLRRSCELDPEIEADIRKYLGQ